MKARRQGADMKAGKSDRKLPEKTARKRQSDKNKAKVSRAAGLAVVNVETIGPSPQIDPEGREGNVHAAIRFWCEDNHKDRCDLGGDEFEALAAFLRRFFPSLEFVVRQGAVESFADKRELLRREGLKSAEVEGAPSKRPLFGDNTKGVAVIPRDPARKPFFFKNEVAVDSTYTDDLTRPGGIAEKFREPNRNLKLRFRALHLAESIMQNALSGQEYAADLYLRDAAAELVEVVGEIIKTDDYGCRLCGGPIPEKDAHGRPRRNHQRLYCCEDHKEKAREARRKRGGQRAGVYFAAELMRRRLKDYYK